MFPRDVRVESPQEALVVEQALAMYRETRRAAAEAADGEVLNVVESLALARGRELTRRTLETVLQSEAEAVEKKTRRPDAAHAAGRGSIAANKRGRSSRRRAR